MSLQGALSGLWEAAMEATRKVKVGLPSLPLSSAPACAYRKLAGPVLVQGESEGREGVGET